MDEQIKNLSKQTAFVNDRYNAIKTELQSQNIDVVTKSLQELEAMMTQNVGRIFFYRKDFIKLLIHLATAQQKLNQIVHICAKILQQCLSDILENSEKLIQQLTVCLHKPKYQHNIMFFCLISLIANNSDSALQLLKSNLLQLLIKFYQAKFVDVNLNCQLTEAMPFQEIAEPINDKDSEKSNASVMSSLSIDEDVRVNVTDHDEILSNRSLLSGLGNQIFEDEDMLQSKQTTNDNVVAHFDDDGSIQSPQSQSPKRYDSISRVSVSNNIVTQVDQFDNISEKLVETEATALNPDQIQQNYIKDFRNEQQLSANVDIAQFTAQQSRCESPTHGRHHLKRAVVNDTSQRLAKYGPLFFQGKEQLSSKSKLLQAMPKLDLSLIKEEHRCNELLNFTNRVLIGEEQRAASPMARTKKYGENIVDAKFESAIYQINRNRQGQMLLEEIGKQIGQFIAMSDYPTVNKMQSIEIMVSQRISQQKTRRLNFDLQDDFEEQTIPNAVNTNSQFTTVDQKVTQVFQNLDEKIETVKQCQQLSGGNEMCQKFGVLMIVNNLLLNIPQYGNIDFDQLYCILMYDLMFQRRQKHGFHMLLVQAIIKILNILQEISIAGKSDDWNIVLHQMFEFVTWELKFQDLKTKEIVEVDDLIKKIVEKKFIYLPSLLFLMPRLEGYRRSLVPNITLLCDKLKNLCKFHKQLSAIEDMPLVLGVLIDIIKASNYSFFIRTSVIEQGLPSILKILQLIISRKIKSRQYYVFISHRLLQLFTSLMDVAQNKLYDSQQANVNQIFINIFVLQAIVVNPWLTRYAYLILMNSRIKMELSGLFINQKQCENAFHEIKLGFLQFVQNISILTKQQVFESRYNISEDSIQINLQSDEILIPSRANLKEMKNPLGDDQQFSLQMNINQLPIHIMLTNQLNSRTLYQLRNKQLIVKHINNIFCKRNANELEIDFSDLSFLSDYNIGVLMQHLMYEQNNIIKSDFNRDIYIETLKALQNVIALPNLLQTMQKQQVNQYIMFHYLSFLKFYRQNSAKYIITDQQVAKYHLDLLLHIAMANNEFRRQLFVIKIIDFLIQEILILDGIYDSQVKINPDVEIIIKKYDPARIAQSTSIQYDFEEIVNQVNKQSARNKKQADDNEQIETQKQQEQPKSLLSKFFKTADVNLIIKSLNNPPQPLNNQQTNKTDPSSFKLQLKKLPDAAIQLNGTKKEESPILTQKQSQKSAIQLELADEVECIYDDGSESDGWGDTAKRLGLDLGEDLTVAKPTPQQTKGTKPKPLFTLNLNNLHGNKQGSQLDSGKQVQNQNLKMHLVMAQNAAQNSSFINSLEHFNSEEHPLKEPSHISIDQQLHLSILLLIFNLIIDPATQLFDQQYVTQFPSNNGMANIPVILHKHLNKSQNKEIVKLLLEQPLEQQHQRLLRLLCFSQFNSEFYPLHQFQLLSKGAFGEVFAGNVSLTKQPELAKYATPVAVKLQPLSLNEKDRCILHDIYNEITVLEKLQHNQYFCGLYDYGVTQEGYLMVMQRYQTSFRRFRINQFSSAQGLRYSNEQSKLREYGHENSLIKYVRIYLLSYLAFLEAIKNMHQQKIIHFDLKSDNIFIMPSSIRWLCTESDPTIQKSEYLNELLEWYLDAESPENLPFLVVLGDFGESHVFTSESDMLTLLSKGTEFNKSPEMLIATNQQFRASFRRSSQQGAGVQSDIWSAACTLYEMLTGDFLFYDSDWIRFFLRATTIPARQQYAYECQTFQDAKQLISCMRGIEIIPEKRAMLGNCQPLIDLLEYQLVQDPTKRPNIDQCITMTQHVLKKYFPHNKFDFSSMFDFSLFGSQQECIANTEDILTPVDISCATMVGPVLRQCQRLASGRPIDILQNGTLFLGTAADMNDATFINLNNYQTIVDCTISAKPTQWVIVNRIFRPAARLVAIFGEHGYSRDKADFKNLLILLEQLFDVIRCTLAQNGCVLFIDDDQCLGANLILACLMEFESFYLYPAVIYLKRIKPKTVLNSSFLELLQVWHDLRTKIGLKLISQHPNCVLNKKIDLNDPVYYNFATTRIALANYRCVCGRTFFVVRPNAKLEYCLCNCVISYDEEKTRDRKTHKITSCPSTSCRTVLNCYNSLFGVQLHKILYAYVQYTDVITNFERATEDVSNVLPFQQCEKQQLQFKMVDDVRMPLFRVAIKDDWRLNYCTMCGAPTHYYRVHRGRKELCIIAIFSNK